VGGTVAKVGFELRKWACTDPALVNSLPEKLRENVDAFELGKEDHEIKTLGIVWTPMTDDFHYKVKHLDEAPTSAKGEKKAARRKAKLQAAVTVETTKRSILADIAKIFDPLGLIAPCTIKLKCACS
jgi:hypothetical protein